MRSIALGLAVCMAGFSGCVVRYYVAEPGSNTSYVAPPPAAVTAPAVDATVTLSLILPAGITDPGPDYIWVEPYPLVDEVVVPGFWRLRERPGFIWVVGYWEQDRYIPGYWKPMKSRGRQWVWVPGHWWGRHWIEGKWRQAKRTGYLWVPGHWSRYGEWQEGYWRPVKYAKPNHVWVPGYWDQNGYWQEGFWRPEHRDGYVWISGYYNGQGLWVTGQWQAAPPAHRWSPGFWDPNGTYTPGRLVSVPDDADYIPGHYDHRNRWKAEQWHPRSQPPRTQEPLQIQRPLPIPPHAQQQPSTWSPAHSGTKQVPDARISDPAASPGQDDQEPYVDEPRQQQDGVNAAPPEWSGKHGRGKDRTGSPESDRGYGRDKVREADHTPQEGLHGGKQRSVEVKRKKGQPPASTEALDQQLFEEEVQPGEDQDQSGKKPRGQKDPSLGGEEKPKPDRNPKQRENQSGGPESKQGQDPDPAKGQQVPMPGSGKGRTGW